MVTSTSTEDGSNNRPVPLCSTPDLAWRDMQVWQNVLQLWEYSTAQVPSASGRRVQVLRPMRRQMVDRNAAAALFVKVGTHHACTASSNLALLRAVVAECPSYHGMYPI